METDDGLVGLGETLGGTVAKALIDTEIAPMFLGESPFDIERMLGKATFVPLYYGKCGYCAIAGLEVACFDLMGKATGLPVCRLLGGRLRGASIRSMRSLHVPRNSPRSTGSRPSSTRAG